jgi:HK97 family phage major capsid protein
MNSTDLKIKRESLIDKVEAFDALATEEKRSLTEGESKSVQDIYSEIDKLDGEIKLAERIEATKAERAAVGAAASKSEEKEANKIASRLDIRNVFTHLRTGKQLDGVEREIHEMGQSELRELHKSGKGFVFPSFMVNHQPLRP